MSENAIIIDFLYRETSLDHLIALEDQLIKAISSSQVGEYDGNELSIDDGKATLFMYGPDADKLFPVVKPVLEACPFVRSATARLRYGPPEPGVREVRIRLRPWGSD